MSVTFLLEQLVEAPFRRDMEQFLNLLSIPSVTDVIANDHNQWWIDRGKGLEPVEQMRVMPSTYRDFARFLVAIGDRHIDQISPITDASITPTSLPVLESLGISRLRVHAVLESELSPVTLLSCRVHRAASLSLEDLLQRQMFTFSQMRHLQQIVESRENFLISGSAGTGKTTLLRALLASDPRCRSVVVEDTAELLPVSGHVVGLQVRQANTERAGEINLEQLAVQALRMRPDRLVLGEVRGSEVRVLLQAMNTGHLGSAATIHANRAGQVLNRLRALALNAGFTDASFGLVASSAIQKVIHLEVAEGRRRVACIEEFSC